MAQALRDTCKKLVVNDFPFNPPTLNPNSLRFLTRRRGCILKAVDFRHSHMAPAGITRVCLHVCVFLLIDSVKPGRFYDPSSSIFSGIKACKLLFETCRSDSVFVQRESIFNPIDSAPNCTGSPQNLNAKPFTQKPKTCYGQPEPPKAQMGISRQKCAAVP